MSAASIIDRVNFDAVYDRVILDSAFFEQGHYYRVRRDRYWNTFRYYAALAVEHPASVLEIGGGQIALLSQEIFHDQATVGDISEDYAEAVIQHGVEFVQCDLVRAIPETGQYEIIVLCEVIEHLPVPLHSVLSALSGLLRPGGWIFLTTPNLYRLRNLVRMLKGQQIFCHWFYPEPGRSLGHVLEYTSDHLVWQMERAGFSDVHCEITQLVQHGHSVISNLNRRLSAPLLRLRPLWRDNLVAWGRISKQLSGQC